jgi:hypothetical protein
VIWEIDIESGDPMTPREVAKEARKAQQDPDSIAGVFQIEDEDQNLWVVDLDNDTVQGSIPPAAP